MVNPSSTNKIPPVSGITPQEMAYRAQTQQDMRRLFKIGMGFVVLVLVGYGIYVSTQMHKAPATGANTTENTSAPVSGNEGTAEGGSAAPSEKAAAGDDSAATTTTTGATPTGETPAENNTSSGSESAPEANTPAVQP